MGAKIIGLAGMPFSGKTVVSETLQELGYTQFKMGDVVRDKMREKDIEINNQNLREYGTKLRQENGRGHIAELCREPLDELLDQNEKVVIDGLRSPESLKVFSRRFGDKFTSIGILVSPGVRYRRSEGSDRDREDDDLNGMKDFRWRDKKEIEYGQAETIVLTEYYLVNQHIPEDEFVEKVKNLVDRI